MNNIILALTMLSAIGPCDKTCDGECIALKIDDDNDGRGDFQGELCGYACDSDEACGKLDPDATCIEFPGWGSYCAIECSGDFDCDAGLVCDYWPTHAQPSVCYVPGMDL